MRHGQNVRGDGEKEYAVTVVSVIAVSVIEMSVIAMSAIEESVQWGFLRDAKAEPSLVARAAPSWWHFIV